MTDHLQAIITVLSLVSLFMCAAIFAQIDAGRSPEAQMGRATKVALVVFVILAVAALVGVKVLHLFGVSLDAFMVAGAGVMTSLEFALLRRLPPGPPPAAGTAAANPSLTPLILSAVSPGRRTITGVITFSVVHAKSGIPVTALVAVAVAATVMWILVVLIARPLGGSGGGGFGHDAVTRFMGLIVIAMGFNLRCRACDHPCLNHIVPHYDTMYQTLSL